MVRCIKKRLSECCQSTSAVVVSHTVRRLAVVHQIWLKMGGISKSQTGRPVWAPQIVAQAEQIDVTGHDGKAATTALVDILRTLNHWQ